MESVSNGCRVVRCERNIVGSNIYLVDNVSHQRIDLFERSDFALEVRVVAGDVRRFDVYDDEVLVLCSLDYSLRLSLIVRLNAPCRSSNVDNINARGACDALDQGCSGDAGASKIKHRLDSRNALDLDLAHRFREFRRALTDSSRAPIVDAEVIVYGCEVGSERNVVGSQIYACA